MENGDVKSSLVLTKDMAPPKPTIDTFFTRLNEEFSGSIRYNSLAGRAEHYDSDAKVWKPWTDVQDATLRWQFQRQGLTHKENLLDAFRLFLETHQVNPLTDLLDSLQWDGTPRIAEFLTRILKAPDLRRRHPPGLPPRLQV